MKPVVGNIVDTALRPIRIVGTFVSMIKSVAPRMAMLEPLMSNME